MSTGRGAAKVRGLVSRSRPVADLAAPESQAEAEAAAKGPEIGRLRIRRSGTPATGEKGDEGSFWRC